MLYLREGRANNDTARGKLVDGAFEVAFPLLTLIVAVPFFLLVSWTPLAATFALSRTRSTGRAATLACTAWLAAAASGAAITYFAF